MTQEVGWRRERWVKGLRKKMRRRVWIARARVVLWYVGWVGMGFLLGLATMWVTGRTR